MQRQLVMFYKYRNMMFNSSRTQNIKEGAYLDYFKYFSISMLDTTRKLETTFHQQFNDELLFDETHMFKVIKKLLNAYQVLILEINDSCEFVQIPQFGSCLVKIYLQLMSVIKYLLRGFIKKGPPERGERQKRHDQRYTMIIPSPQVYPDMPEVVERESIRLRENASHIFKDLTMQVKSLEKEQKNSMQQSQDTIAKIHQNRQRLQTIQSSQSQNVLNEAVTILFRKGEHINNFLNLLQSGQNYVKEQPETFSKIKQKIDEDNLKKIITAKFKLSELFATHISEHEQQKKDSMVSRQIQINMDEIELDDMVRKRKSAHKKTHIDQTKKLRAQINNLEEENIALRDYIKSKIEQHQNQTTVIVAEKIKLQSKLSAAINQKKSLTFNSKGSINFTNIDGCESVQNFQNSLQMRSHVSIDFQNKDSEGAEVGRNTFKQSRVKIPKHTKSKVKFSPSATTSNLRHQSKEFQFTLFSSKIEAFQFRPQPKIEQIKIEQEDKPNVIIEQSQQNEESMKCQDVLLSAENQSQILLLKITSPMVKNCSDIDSWNEKENLQISKKEQCSIRVKKTDSKALSEAVKDGKNRKMTKKESIITFVQDVQPKKVTDFSQASGFKPDSSKENIKTLEKEVERSKEIKRSYRFYQKESNLSESSQKWLQTELSQNFSEVALRALRTTIQFKQEDLNHIFFSLQNAKNYQILNLSLASKQKKFLSAQSGKTLVKTLKTSKPKQELSPDLATPQSMGANSAPGDACSFLIGVVFEALNFIKKDKNNYRIICSFLRYPYSAIFMADSKDWKTYQNDEQPIDYLELRKMLTRLIRLHSECSQTLCLHWRYFLNKIGIEFH